MINFQAKVQRFAPGHPLYSDAIFIGPDPEDPTGNPARKFQSTFGQIVDINGNFICYDLERRDKLIPEGTFNFTFTKSTVNKCIVPLLIGVPGRQAIENHIADTPAELLGCTAPGTFINKAAGIVSASELAWCKLITLIIGQPFKRWQDELLVPYLGQVCGSFTYETLKN
jgi:hypothetical protein